MRIAPSKNPAWRARYGLAFLLSLTTITAARAETPEPIESFTKTYCIQCHGTDKQKGDFRIDTLPWDLTSSDSREQWDLVYEYVELGDMPEEKAKKHPGKAKIESFLGKISAAMAQADESAQPGGTPLRRLNRTEYLNTVRDLFGIRGIDLPLSFPADAPGAEFDTMPKGLFLSPAVLDAYHETATDIADRVAPLLNGSIYKAKYTTEAIGGDEIRTWYGPPMTDLNGQFWKRYKKKDYLMFTGSNNSGWMGAVWDPLLLAPRSGVYRVRLLANGQAEVGADGKPLRLGFYAFDPTNAGELPKRYRREWATRVAEVHVPDGNPTWVDCYVPLEAGETFHIYCENRYPEGRFPDETYLITKPESISLTKEAMLDPTPTIELRGMEVEGPMDALPRTKKLFGTWPPQLNRVKIESKLLPLAARAFRRPLTPLESEKLVTAVLEHGKQTGQSEYAWHYAIRRLLCSPAFLYREVEDSDFLSQYALASRLSYFLWSSLPDDELIRLAATEKLSDPAVLAAQVQRLLDAPKSHQFVKHFTGQWLGNREVEAINVCDIRYEWDKNVRYGFVRSTEEFFEEILRENLPISTFVDSDFTYANTAMQAVWGMKGGASLDSVAALQRHSQVWPEPERLNLNDLPEGTPEHVSNRGGVLGLPGVLAVTGDGVESSPILRGVWVLGNLFGKHPPPPPKDVPALDIDTSKATSVRETLKAHTELGSCTKCHRDIDPLGLALENYDAIGGWRTRYVGDKTFIDASSTMPDGAALDGPASIKRILKECPEIFTNCLLTKLLEYGAGRELSVGDRRIVNEIVNAEPSEGYRFGDLINLAVQSEVFRAK
ncbi:MAG: DUF1592 domain-containing protein [Opitutales bacterium]|nr:DUF1592 domain-containing protein [Opitutales bacterium]MBT5813812.1 DUF1592 domain-containing protein [Opitutales bacterium]